MSPPNWSSHGGPRSSWSTMTTSPWAGSCPTTSSTHSCPATGGCTSRGSCNEHPGGGRAYRPRAAAAQGQGRPGLADPGPGVVAANAGNDAAGIATYASAGSQFVYRTLFFMVLVTFALVLVQEMAVRLGTH